MSGTNADQSNLVRFDVMAAMCHGNRGIGMDRSLPWPSLKNDVSYYKGKCRSYQNKESENGDKYIIHICGRKTWEGNNDRSYPTVRYVIISNTMKSENPSILKAVPSFEAALQYTTDLQSQGQVDSVWIMGGSRVYEEALNHPQCNRLYLTHVYQDFSSDAFFPKFEDSYVEVTDGLPAITKHEDNGVKYEFKAYEKKTTS